MNRRPQPLSQDHRSNPFQVSLRIQILLAHISREEKKGWNFTKLPSSLQLLTHLNTRVLQASKMANFLHWNGTCQQNFWKLVSHAIIISKRIRYLALPDIASHQHNSWSISLKVNLLLNELKRFPHNFECSKRGLSEARTEPSEKKHSGIHLEKLEWFSAKFYLLHSNFQSCQMHAITTLDLYSILKVKIHV